MTSERVVIVADSSTQMGQGHLARCHTLALAFQQAGWHVCLIGQNLLGNGLARLMAAQATRPNSPPPIDVVCIPLVMEFTPEVQADQKAQQQFAKTIQPYLLGASLLIVDHYSLGSAFYQCLSSAPLLLMAIDDLANRELPVDILLDQNFQGAAPNSKPELASVTPGWRYLQRVKRSTRMLIGPKYALLRAEFQQWQRVEPVTKPRLERLLISLGGSDPLRFTEQIIQALAASAYRELAIDVVVGAAYPALDALTIQLQALTNARLHVQTSQMAAFIHQADLVIGAAGGSTWERALIATPAMVFSLAANQQPALLALAEAGALINAGAAAEFNADGFLQMLAQLDQRPELRQQLAKTARQLMGDGDGAALVVKRIQDVMTARQLVCRPVTLADAALLLQWANEPAVRAQGFHPEPIAWDDHLNWMQRRLASPAELFYLIEHEQRPIAQVRFSPRPQHGAEIHISLSRDIRGQGLASPVLLAAITTALHQAQTSDWQFIDALVRESNFASTKAFLRAGFYPFTQECIGNVDCHWLRYPIMSSLRSSDGTACSH